MLDHIYKINFQKGSYIHIYVYILYTHKIYTHTWEEVWHDNNQNVKGVVIICGYFLFSPLLPQFSDVAISFFSQGSVLSCFLSLHSLGDLNESHGFKYKLYAEQISISRLYVSSRLKYTTVCSTFPLRCLHIISNITHPRVNFLLPLPPNTQVSHLSLW